MALPTKIQLHIVSADRSLVNETVDEVEIPGAEGYFGVLPGHTPILALLGAGELWYRQGTEKHFLSMAFGFAEVQPDQVTILAADRRARRRNRPRAGRGREEARRRTAGETHRRHGCRACPHFAAQVADSYPGRDQGSRSVAVREPDRRVPNALTRRTRTRAANTGNRHRILPIGSAVQSALKCSRPVSSVLEQSQCSLTSRS